MWPHEAWKFLWPPTEFELLTSRLDNFCSTDGTASQLGVNVCNADTKYTVTSFWRGCTFKCCRFHSETNQWKLWSLVHLDEVLQIMWWRREVSSEELYQSSPCVRWYGLLCAGRAAGKRALQDETNLSRSVIPLLTEYYFVDFITP